MLVVPATHATISSGVPTSFPSYGKPNVARFASYASAIGPEHRPICVADFSAPAIDQLFEFNEFVDRKLADGEKVLVHCYAGRGRTGTFLASRLVWRGASVEDGVKEVRDKILKTQGTLAGAIEPVQMEALHRFARLVPDAAAKRR